MSETPSTPVVIETRGSAIIARAQKKMMDDDELKQLAQSIDSAINATTGISLVVLDLSLVRIMPSLALGLLVQMSQKCRARQQRLKLAAVHPQVRQVFSITRLDRLFEFVESVEAALI